MKGEGVLGVGCRVQERAWVVQERRLDGERGEDAVAVPGLEFRAYGLGFVVEGSGYRGLGFRVWGSGFRG